uniref:neutral amino acid transporter 9-like isoform X1 n=3 Tax=Myxine glutinosa TaxID=7769 RepID=UPI00358EADCE
MDYKFRYCHKCMQNSVTDLVSPLLVLHQGNAVGLPYTYSQSCSSLPFCRGVEFNASLPFFPGHLYSSSLLSKIHKNTMTTAKGKQPSFVTIFAIWNTMMGTSILSIPWAIMQAGLTFGVILIFFMGFITMYSCYRILQSPRTLEGGSDLDFPDVCGRYFGRTGRWICLFFSMMVLGGALIVYWVLMANFLYNTGAFIYDKVNSINVTSPWPGHNTSLHVLCQNPPAELSQWTNGHFLNGASANVNASNSKQDKTGKSRDGTSRMGEVLPVDTDLLSPGTTEGTMFDLWWHKQRTVPLYLVLIVLPLLNFKSAQFFARFNNLGTLSVAYLIILVTIKAARWGINLEYHWIECDNPFFVPEFRSFFPAMTGILTLAFFIHNCSITLFKNNRNQHNNVRDLMIAYILVGSTYLYVGCLVFASFPVNPFSKSCIEQNFLDNFPADDVSTFIARVCLLFQLMTVYPLLAFFIRVQLFTQLFGKSYPSFLHVLVLNIILVSTGVIMASFYPNIGTIIRYSGAICGLAFVFIFPCLIHLIHQRRHGRLTVSSVIFHGLFMLFGLANLFSQFFI